MNKLLTAALAIMIALPASLSAKSFTRVLEVKGNISAINSSGNIEVEYTPAAKVSAVIKVEYKEDIANVTSSLKGGVLSLSTKGKTKGEITVKLSAPGINNLDASGNSTIEVEGSLSGRDVDLRSSGNAGIKIEQNINAPKVTINTGGNSSVKVSGTLLSPSVFVNTDQNSVAKIAVLDTDNLDVKTEGNSSFKSKQIKAGAVKATSTNNSVLTLAGRAGTVSYTSKDNSILKAGSLQANGGMAEADGNSQLYSNINGLQPTSRGNAVLRNK